MTNRYELAVEAFSLFNEDKNDDAPDRLPIVLFEVDPELYHGVDVALGNPQDVAERLGRRRLASQAALVLIELGIDGESTHRVRVDRTGNRSLPGEDPALYDDAFNYPRGGEALILGDAVEALQAVVDQLLVMRSVAEARQAERNAVTIGADAQRAGLLADA